MGRHGIGKMNSNGHRLLSFCSQNEFLVSNTLFDLKNIYKGSWMHPRSKIYHMLDYVLLRKRDRQDIRITRVMRGADCWTDHLMVRSVLALRIRPPARKGPSKKKLNCATLAVEENRTTLAAVVESKLTRDAPTRSTTENWVEDSWRHISRSLTVAAEEVLGFTKRKNADWFDENISQIQDLLQHKYKLHAALKNIPSSVRLGAQWEK